MELSNYFAAERGAQAVLARTLGLPAPLLSAWASKDPCKRRPVPVERCPDIERATNGAVTCEELRADKTWTRVPDLAWPHSRGRPLVDFARQLEVA